MDKKNGVTRPGPHRWWWCENWAKASQVSAQLLTHYISPSLPFKGQWRWSVFPNRNSSPNIQDEGRGRKHKGARFHLEPWPWPGTQKSPAPRCPSQSLQHRSYFQAYFSHSLIGFGIDKASPPISTATQQMLPEGIYKDHCNSYWYVIRKLHFLRSLATTTGTREWTPWSYRSHFDHWHADKDLV